MGGAIFNHGGALSILNSTLTSNNATGAYSPYNGCCGANGLGGAVFNLNGVVTIEFSTLAANTVTAGQDPINDNPAAGGAVYSLAYNLVSGQSATLTIYNSILSGSIGGPDVVSDQPATVWSGNNAAAATLIFEGQNIIPNLLVTAGAENGPSPLTADPQLAALALNAPGLAATMAITSSSPAFDAAPCDPAVTTDQRGVTRPQGASCDIGAYELALTAQTITFSLPSTATYGSGPYTLNATASSGLPVTYSVTGPATVSGSTLTITGVGMVTVTASQSGNNTYAPATSVTQTMAVSQASQTITFTGLPSTATYGSAGPYTLNATASSGLPVSYSVTGPAGITGSTLTITGVGTVAVAASQAGNTDYAAAASVTQSIVVSAQSQTITFAAISAQIAGASVTLTATASSGLSVSFNSLTTSVCTVSGTTATMVVAGTCSIQASQAGNGQYAAASPVTQSFTVNSAAGFTITPIPGSENVYPGLPLAGYTLELQSVDGFNGNVTLSCSSSVASSICLDLPQTVRVKGTTGAFTGILFPANTKAGTYTVTFKGVSGSLTKTATATFTVK